jgi:TolB protein
MTVQHDLDHRLTSYLDARARGSVRDGLLGEALAAIETTGQRPGWTDAEWWFGPRAATHMSVATRMVASVATLALLVLLVVALIVFVGSQRRLPPPFGLAKSGLIAVVSDGHLFTMNADGTGRQQLTFGPGKAYQATWSLDGTRIAYLSTSADCPKDSCLGEPSALKIISPDSGTSITIADGLAASSVGQISWSPDGRRLAFAAVRAGALASPSRLYVAEADGSGARLLGDEGLAGFQPAWSPDGTQLVFMRLAPTPALWLIRPDGSNAHPLTSGKGFSWEFWNAQWSPDGSHLVYLSGAGGHRVWTVNADGTDEHQLVNRNDDAWWPSWSPDGSRIAFVEAVGPARVGRFVVVDRDGSHAIALDGPSVDGSTPVWSPDGTKLFGFISGNADCTPCQYNQHHPVHQGIAVYDATGKTPPTVVPTVEDGTWQRLALD